MDETTQFRSTLSRYGIAVFLVLVAAVVRYALTPLVGYLTPLLFFTLAQVAVALLAGRGPGLLSVLLGTIIGYYLFMQPGKRLDPIEELYYVSMNVFVGVVLIWMADGMHQSRNEARQTAAALRATNQRLTDLMARIRDAFFSFDLDCKCLYANARAAAMAGLAPQEMIGKSCDELLPGIFTPERTKLLSNAAERQDYLALDGVSDQEGLWFELSAYPSADSVSVFIHDATDRKRAEIATSRSEEHFRKIFNESPVGMMIADMDGKFRRANNAICKMLEYTPEELISLSVVDVTPPEDLETSGFYSEKQQELVRGNIEYLQMEKRYLTKSGRILLTNLNASVLRESDDSVLFLGIVENITERRQVEEQLRESQKIESLGVLAGGIAHDFNNLLTGILGNASLGLEIAPSDSPLRPLLQRLVRASERAADLTRQLLAYAGKGRFVLQALELSQMVKDISSLVLASFPAHVHLDLKLAPELSAIEADPAQIQQVIMNLLLNAAESIPADREGRVVVKTSIVHAGEAELRSTLSSGHPQPGKYVLLEVGDNGCGIDATTQQRIFEPFFSTKFTGRGLGLAAVLGIVGSYGGALKVQSQIGVGTTFQVLLPVSTKPLKAPSSPGPHPDEVRGRGTILVVDDEPVVLALARSALERLGYSVLLAETGTAAEEIMKRSGDAVSAVILDVTMPGMNGVETFRRLRGIRSDVPVVLSSGHSEDETMTRFAEEGLAGFLQKPYSPAQLAEKVNAAIQVRVKTC